MAAPSRLDLVGRPVAVALRLRVGQRASLRPPRSSNSTKAAQGLGTVLDGPASGFGARQLPLAAPATAEPFGFGALFPTMPFRRRQSAGQSPPLRCFSLARARSALPG